jgi:hypothetical protein
MVRLSNKKILLIAGWIVYAAFMLTKRFGMVYHPIIQGYFSDILSIPLMLGLILLLMRIYTGDKSFTLSALKVFVAFIYISITFEFILPLYNNNFHKDYWDLLAYGLGSLIFILIQRSKKINTFKSNIRN